MRKLALKEHAALLSMISALLEYPESSLLPHLPEIRDTVSRHPSLPPASRDALCMLVDHLASQALLDLQEAYVQSFDQGRNTSLYLFEHVHGESRDRGQAMVDLLAMYEKNGLYLAPGELPDFLPVFLEFAAHEPVQQARSLLDEIEQITRTIAERLIELGIPYYAAVGALLPLAGAQEVDDRGFVIAARLDSMIDADELDEQWQDQPVSFMHSPDPAMQEQAIHFYEKRPTT